ncbi:RsiV family protein [Romboutsia maritimum]|nr:RsiV family protein [Romboutsia maritimum]
MLSIEAHLIEEEIKELKYILKYPSLKNEDKKINFIKYINTKIYEDVTSFKDVLQSDFKIYIAPDYITYGITEYLISFNKNKIISIPIEFSQLIGLYDISYINCYNYDLNLEKEIMLVDIFNDKAWEIDILNRSIKKKLKNTIYNNEYISESIKNEEIEKFEGICSDQSFYIEEDGIVICFSSYEIGSENFQTIEVKFTFEECEEYLSAYTINNICI